MTVYFISGLGADERMFQKLSLPQSWNIGYISWLTPLHKESLSSYCHRLSSDIDTSEEFVLVGLSFGGIVAVELSKIVTPKLIILISSIVTKSELPAVARFFAKTKLDKLIPASLLRMPAAFIPWFFGTDSSEEKQLVKQTIANTPSGFLKWSLHEIITWQNEQRPQNLIHIHGTKDRLFPIKNTKADIKIEGGGHLMVYNKADEISYFVTKLINGYP